MFTATFAVLVHSSFGATGIKDLPVKADIENNSAWYDTTQWAPEAQGWHNGLARYYARVPSRSETVLPKSVWDLAQHSAGLFFRFRTNANSIQVKYKLYSGSVAMPHMPATGKSGLDLYCQKDGKWLWAGITKPTKQEGQETLISGMEATMKEFILYLPLYNGIDKLSIGVPKGSEFFAQSPRTDKAIVYYGTSIAHGGCASRPGMAYTAMLGRRLDKTIINLGFSGSARMEPAVADLMAELDPELFVLDPVPNMSPELVEQRAVPFIQKIRAKHPNTPILMVEDRLYSNAWLQPEVMKRQKKQQENFKKAFDFFVSQGDKNIHYLPHDNLLGENLDQDGTVDRSHPNDLGMYRMTDALENAIRKFLK